MTAIVETLTAYKNCSACDRSYTDRQHYVISTAFVGVIKTGKYSEFDLELRNCKCGSTLATYTAKENSKNLPRLSSLPSIPKPPSTIKYLSSKKKSQLNKTKSLGSIHKFSEDINGP